MYGIFQLYITVSVIVEASRNQAGAFSVYTKNNNFFVRRCNLSLIVFSNKIRFKNRVNQLKFQSLLWIFDP